MAASADIQSEGQQIKNPTSEGRKKVGSKVAVGQETDAAGGDRRSEEYVYQMEMTGPG